MQISAKRRADGLGVPQDYVQSFRSLKTPEEKLALVIKTQRWARENLKRRDLTPEKRKYLEEVNSLAWSAQKAVRHNINRRKRNAQSSATRS